MTTGTTGTTGPLAAEPVRLGLTPLKGARHTSLPTVHLNRHGALGDRRFCLVDPVQGRVLRTVQHPRLTTLTASVIGPTNATPATTRTHSRDLSDPSTGDLRLTLPDGSAVSGAWTRGEEITCDYWGRPATLSLLTGPHSEFVSDVLRRPVTLALAPPRAVIYSGAVSLITAASLADLADRVGAETVDPSRFRATAVVETAQHAYAEDAWTGREITLGTAVLRVSGPIGRCAVIDIDPATGDRNGGLLRALSTYRPRSGAGEPTFGVYAEVVRPGVVTVTGEAAAPAPTSPRPAPLRQP